MYKQILGQKIGNFFAVQVLYMIQDPALLLLNHLRITLTMIPELYE